MKASTSCPLDTNIGKERKPFVEKVKTTTIHKPATQPFTLISKNAPSNQQIATTQDAIVLTEERLDLGDAKLIDAYIIIKTMYEDLVKAGVNSTGRKMAGRLLYSEEFEQFKNRVKGKL